jgi:CRISPR/Cas system-associated endonuclease Cas3-HD
MNIFEKPDDKEEFIQVAALVALHGLCTHGKTILRCSLPQEAAKIARELADELELSPLASE